MEKLTEAEMSEVRALIDLKIEQGNPQDLDIYEEVERVADEVRAQYRGKAIAISTEIDAKQGTYVVFVEGVPTTKGRVVPLEKRERLPSKTIDGVEVPGNVVPAARSAGR